MPNFIRVDIFPANVTVNGVDSYSPSRAIVTDDAIHVYQDAPGGPTEVYTTRLDDFEGRRNIGYTITGANGDTVSLTSASGCGCGSRLRGYHPFVGIPHVSNP